MKESLFDYEKLSQCAESARSRYGTALPFPHIVLDEIANSELLAEAVKRFPSPEELSWFKYDNPLERKLAMPDIRILPEVFQLILRELNSNRFLHFLERLTSIEGLSADPEFHGGGLHQITKGGKLDIHADFNYHPKTGLDRRLNVLLYLNEDWAEDYGGHLELWDRAMSRAMKKISPIFNRMVIFNTTDFSFHGHPEPLNCPHDRSRKSIALYYYTNGRPDSEKTEPHSTLFQKRPQDREDPDIAALRQMRARKRIADLKT